MKELGRILLIAALTVLYVLLPFLLADFIFLVSPP